MNDFDTNMLTIKREMLEQNIRLTELRLKMWAEMLRDYQQQLQAMKKAQRA